MRPVILTFSILVICCVFLVSSVAFAAENQKIPAETIAGPSTTPPVKEEPKKAEPKLAENKIEKILNMSDKYWKQRHKGGFTKRSIDEANKALAEGADEFEVKWRMARGYFWMAERANHDKKKKEYGKKGWEAGLRAAEIKPKRVEGWFWGVTALGQYATAVGIVASLFRGLGGKFEDMNEKALKIDRNYAWGGPTRSYGRFWFSLPKIKRDLERSEKLLKESIKAAPKKLRSHLYLAETYLEMDKKDEAKAELELCVSLDPKKEEYPDGIIFKPLCKELLKSEFGK